jgi:uncharacterized protein YpuA (DUF1002 family)
MVGESLNQHLAVIANQWHRRPQIPPENVEQVLRDTVIRLRLYKISEQINELTALHHNAHNADEQRYYNQKIDQFKQTRHQLDQTRDALTLTGKRRQEANQFGEPLQ